MIKLLIGESEELGKILELLDEFPQDFTVTTAEDGSVCLREVEEDLPDLIILSCCLPEIDGIETCRMLKDSSRGKDVPVLLLMAEGTDVETKKKALEAGVDDYLVMPCDSIDLANRIQMMLKLKKFMDEAGQGESDRLSPFLAHKLRSPLNSIIGMAELIQKPYYGELNEKQKKFIGIISSSGYRLVEFIKEHASD